MKVYIVGNCAAEHNTIEKIYVKKDNAIKEWNNIRLRILEEYQRMAKDGEWEKEFYAPLIKNMESTDIDNFNNYPHEAPFIEEYIIEDLVDEANVK